MATMEEEQFEKFIQKQVKKMREDKRKAEKKAGHALGQEFEIEWIDKNSEIFRQNWNKKH